MTGYQPASITILRGTPEPVEIEIRRDHPFKKRATRGCAVCNKSKLDRLHLGAPPSLNEGGSGMNRHSFQALKQAWQRVLTSDLIDTGLPRGLAGVTVEGLIGFPTLAERDQGNFRWMIEKALGDALVAGGWLSSDCFFPTSRYEFGGLQAVHHPRESWIRLTLFPRFEEASHAA